MIFDKIFKKKPFPRGYGFLGSCAVCPERLNCDEGKDCKIFKPRKETRQLVYEKFNGRCAYCGCKIEPEDMQVDRVKPLQRGRVGSIQLLSRIGKDDTESYNPSCRSCNLGKGRLSIDEFRAELQKGVERLLKDPAFRLMVKYGQVCVSESPIRFHFEQQEEGNQPGKK